MANAAPAEASAVLESTGGHAAPCLERLTLPPHMAPCACPPPGPGDGPHHLTVALNTYVYSRAHFN